jgi:S-adenosyl-L-methionine hydrolase (adenosine-forming)
MAHITLTTDWGADGAYSGAFKGALCSFCPGVSVVDITNTLHPFDIGQAAFVLSQSFMFFPQGTVHVAGINAEKNDKSLVEYVAIEALGHFFVGQNSGLWELLIGESDCRIFQIESKPKMLAATGFPELEVLARAAAHIAKGMPIENLGRELKINALARQLPALPKLAKNFIQGQIIFFDAYGNAITNINRQDIEEVGSGLPIEIRISSAKHIISRISANYKETVPGNLLAIYSFSGYLEIALANGSARNILSLSLGSELLVRFSEKLPQKTLF